MTMHDFLFTTEKPARYYRHVAFWAGQCIFWGLWATVFLHGAFGEYFLFQLRNKQYFIPDISYTYVVIYYLYPQFLLRRKRVHFYLFLFILTAATYILFIAYSFWIRDLVNEPKDKQLLMAWFFSWNFITSGPPVVCALFLVFKLFKSYYIKMQNNLLLIQENTNAELQLLKAQIHPHFLFNTLNNIYSFSLDQSPQAGILVHKLLGMLQYMINDCEGKQVSLEKELKLIEDYMGLEKVRYGKRLSMEISIHGDIENKLIAPLLMIPFVENSFKHGTSQMRQPWIKLEIRITAGQLFLKLTNSRPSLAIPNKMNKGIGLMNVKKRLQLLYPGKHQLDIHSTEDRFTVNLMLLLGENELAEERVIQTENIIAYG